MANNYSLSRIRNKILKTSSGKISSKNFGNWIFHAWYYYMEGPGCDPRLKNRRIILAILEDISAEWGVLSSKKGDKEKLSPDYLKEIVRKLNKLL